MKKILRGLVVILMSQSLIFSPLVYADQLALPSGDLIAPQISHEPLNEKIKAGTSQQIKATITDNVGVKTVTLFFRTVGAKDYKRIQMNQVEGSDEYVATLGFEDTVEPGIEYYIQAVDLAGNALLHGYSFSPLTVGIVPSEGAPATSVTQAPTESAVSDQSPKDEPLGDKKKTNKWLWIGLGVLAVGVIAAVAGGGDSGGEEPVQTGTVSLNAPVPGN